MNKKISLKLTEKQLEAVTSCLYEWGMVERDTFSGKSLSKYYHRVLASIHGQSSKQGNANVHKKTR